MQISHAALRSSQLALADGVANRPALRFRQEPSSGLRRLAPGRVGLDILGTTRLEVNNTTGVLVNGNLSLAGSFSAQGGVNNGVAPLTVTPGLTVNGPLGVTGAGNVATFAGQVNANNGMLVQQGINIQTGGLHVQTNTQIDGVLTLGSAVTSQIMVPGPFLGIYDTGSGARGVKVGSLVVSSTYGPVPPDNGIYSLGAITSDAVVTGTRLVALSGGASITGGLTLVGATAHSFGGLVTFGNGITVNGAVGTFNAGLTVGGAIGTFNNGVNAANSSISATFDISAGRDIGASHNIAANGQLSGATLLVNPGVATMWGGLNIPGGNNDFAGQLTVHGGLQVPGGNNDFAGQLIVRNGINVTVGGLTVGGTYTAAFSGPVTVGVGLTVNGSINLQTGTLTVGGTYQTHLTGPLVADSTASVGGNLTCYGQNYGQTVYANAGLTVASGGASITGPLTTTSGNLTINGNTTLQGDSYLGAHVSVNNVITGTYPSAANVGDPGLPFYAVYATVGAIQPSKRSLKERIEALDATAALDAVLATPIYSFRYIRWPSGRPPADRTPQAAGEPHPLVPIREVDEGDAPLQVGFMADEAHPLLLFGTDAVTAQTTASVALAAIQALAARILILEKGAPR